MGNSYKNESMSISNAFETFLMISIGETVASDSGVQLVGRIQMGVLETGSEIEIFCPATNETFVTIARTIEINHSLVEKAGKSDENVAVLTEFFFVPFLDGSELVVYKKGEQKEALRAYDSIKAQSDIMPGTVPENHLKSISADHQSQSIQNGTTGKVCPKCNSMNEANASFCTSCGHSLNDSENTDNTKSRYFKPIIIGAAILLLILIGVVIIFALNDNKSMDESNVQQKEKVSKDTEHLKKNDSIVIPDGVEKFHGHYYMVVDDAAFWSEARKACEERGGHLATITSQREQDFIADLIGSNGEKMNYWLGAADHKHEGNWKWITGEPWSYTNWRDGQPDNRNNEDVDGDQDYLQICCGSYEDDRYMKWYDMSNSGISYGYEGYPNYKDTQYCGYVCEWDSTDELKGMD